MKRIRAFASCFTAICVLFMCSCMNYTSFDELSVTNASTTVAYTYTEQTTLPVATEENLPSETTLPSVQPEISTLPPEESTASQVTVPLTTEAAVTSPEATLPVVTQPDYSSFSKETVLDVYKSSLELTRAYTGELTVKHTEAFNADIKDAHPGGALTELLADNIVKLVGSEGNQTLSFSGGKATNKDGESVPILLPQRTAFSLTADGIKNATVTPEGDKLRVRIVLVPETVSMGETPKHNASAIGYLDTSDMEFKIITISRVDITYPGSVIEAVILGNGYIESVLYTINMSTYAELSGMGITGYGTLEGAQTEKWELMW